MRRSTLYLLLSLTALGCGVLAAWQLQPRMLPATGAVAHDDVTIPLRWQKRYGGAADWSGVGWVTLHLQLRYPQTIEVGDSDIVTVVPELVSAEPAGAAPDFDAARVLREAGEALSRGGMALTLHMPSAEVQPERLSRFAAGSPSKWVVRFAEAGQVAGFVQVEFPDASTLDIQVADQPEIRVDVQEAFLTRDNILAFLATLLGPLVSIPGIFAFWRSFRRERKAPDEGARIIV